MSKTAEQSFFTAMTREEVGTKTAAELSQETRDLLGLSETPLDLDRLESNVGPYDDDIEPGEVAEALPVGTSQPKDKPRSPGAGVSAGTPVEPGALIPPPEEATAGEVAPSDLAQVEMAEALAGQKLAPLFRNEMTHPATLAFVLSERYGNGWLEWESETLFYAIRRDFGPLNPIVRHSIQALRVSITTNLAWFDWDVFENTGHAWTGTIPRFGEYQPLSSLYVAFANETLDTLRSDEEWSAEVSAYMAAVLDQEGFVFAPEEWFPGAQRLLDRNKEGHVLRDQVEMVWRKAQNADPSDIEWSPSDALDIQIGRLTAIRLYLEQRSRQLSLEMDGVARSGGVGVPS